jgi:hypothetical protein
MELDTQTLAWIGGAVLTVGIIPALAWLSRRVDQGEVRSGEARTKIYGKLDDLTEHRADDRVAFGKLETTVGHVRETSERAETEARAANTGIGEILAALNANPRRRAPGDDD